MVEFLTNLMPNVVEKYPELIKCFWQTVDMVWKSGLISATLGTIFGIALVVTAPDNIMPNRVVNTVLDKVINVIRAIPFIILIALLVRMTRAIMGTAIGTKGALVPLVFGTVPFFSRQIQSALVEIDPGIVEAAQSMGQSPLQIIWRVYLREGLGGMIRGITITLINLIGLTAMAGAVGAGGLGDFAIRYGYQRYQTDITYVTVIILLVMVTLVQSIGNIVTRKLKH